MRSGAALVALVVAVSVPALAGCSAKAAPSAADPLPTGSTVSAGPGPSGGSARPPAGPSLVFPRDVHLTFEYVNVGDEAKDAVLHDWEAGQRVFNAAETLADPGFRLLPRYQAAKALASAVHTLRTKRQRRETIVGTRRFYRVALGKVTESLADVTWCVDDSQFFARNVATGKAIVHHGPGDYYRVHGILQHDPKNNLWVLVDVVSEVGVRC
jgi:hypothetical protein